MNILFVGDLNVYGRSFYRSRDLVERHRVTSLSYVPTINGNGDGHIGIFRNKLRDKILWRLGFPVNDNSVHKTIRETLASSPFDVVWIEKGQLIRGSLLDEIRTTSLIKYGFKPIILLFSEDDFENKANSSYWLHSALGSYDLIVTTKAHNMQYLKTRAPKSEIILAKDSFHHHVHKPQFITQTAARQYGALVGAIGAYESERAEMLRYLITNNFPVRIFGAGWERFSRKCNLSEVPKFLVGSEYPISISSTKINLNFLRLVNRDRITSRSIEIPAVGGFLLTQRSCAHAELFKMGVEADDFGSAEELLSKVAFYLERPRLVDRIAKCGREKVLSDSRKFIDVADIILSKAASMM